MFMNRVHEQRPKIDSGTIPSQNGSKIGRVHRVHSPRPARMPSAQAVCLPPSQPCPVRARACCRARPARLQHARSPSAQRLLRPAATCALHARPHAPCALSRAPTTCPAPLPSVTIQFCIATHFGLLQSSCNTIQSVYIATQLPFPLQYNSHVSQYTLSLPTCNTVLYCN